MVRLALLLDRQTPLVPSMHRCRNKVIDLHDVERVGCTVGSNVLEMSLPPLIRV